VCVCVCITVIFRLTTGPLYTLYNNKLITAE